MVIQSYCHCVMDRRPLPCPGGEDDSLNGNEKKTTLMKKLNNKAHLRKNSVSFYLLRNPHCPSVCLSRPLLILLFLASLSLSCHELNQRALEQYGNRLGT